MIVRSITHRGLQRLIEDDDPRRLSFDLVPRIRNILSFLILSHDMEEFIGGAPPGMEDPSSVGIAARPVECISFRELENYL